MEKRLHCVLCWISNRKCWLYTGSCTSLYFLLHWKIRIGVLVFQKFLCREKAHLMVIEKFPWNISPKKDIILKAEQKLFSKGCMSIASWCSIIYQNSRLAIFTHNYSSGVEHQMHLLLNLHNLPIWMINRLLNKIYIYNITNVPERSAIC